jgi:MscS family membrane protein
MDAFQDFLNTYFPGNAWTDVLLFGGILLGGLLARRFISIVISRGLFQFVRKRSQNIPVQEFIALLRQPLEALFMLGVLYLAFNQLRLPDAWQFAATDRFGFRLLARKAFELLVIVAATWATVRLVKFAALVFTKRAELTDSKTADQLVPFFRNLGIALVLIFAFFVFLGKIFAVDIAALVTGLGVGGLAVALAARETLENLLASFTIFAERPFVAGDVIQIGTLSGSVERIGFRSTSIRTADGSSLLIPNRLIVSQSLENQSQRQFRRARYLIGLQLDTPSERLREIIAEIQAVLDANPLTRVKPGTVHFDGFGEQSLDLLLVYHVATTDFDEFNRMKEVVNFRITEIVRQYGASFASPLTQAGVRPAEGQQPTNNQPLA